MDAAVFPLRVLKLTQRYTQYVDMYTRHSVGGKGLKRTSAGVLPLCLLKLTEYYTQYVGVHQKFQRSRINTTVMMLVLLRTAYLTVLSLASSSYRTHWTYEGLVQGIFPRK